MTINEIILKRFSTVLFSDKPVEREKLITLFEVARWAPSSYNEQPWRFIYGIKRDHDVFIKFLECLSEANKEWASNAPVLCLSLAKKNYSRNNLSNRFALYETGMAVGNMLLQAIDLGLNIHQMAGYNVEQAIKNLEIPDDFSPIAMMAIGYKAESGNFPDELIRKEKRSRERKELSDLVSYSRYSNFKI